MRMITAFMLRQLTFMVMSFLFFYVAAVMLTGNWNITLWTDASIILFDFIWTISAIAMHTAWYEWKN